ncbi:MAG TPA: AsmA-like C-terminal domain-containing protein, partial [Nitrospiraceae bacterium]|nr:AsmA-like C-terminal domain-containing protein [Nitrospiraceae bacterium]
LLIPPIRLAGEGHIRLSDEWDFEARVAIKPISLQKLPQGVSIGAVKAGVLEISLTMRGYAMDRSSWDASGHIRFTNGLIVLEHLPHAIRNVALTAQFDHQSIGVRRLSLTIGDSDLRVRGSIAGWTATPQATLVVESSQFDLALLHATGRSGRDTQRPSTSSWWTDSRLTATVFVQAAYYDRFLFTNTSCRISLNHGVLTIDHLTGDTDDGHVGGRVVVQPPERQAGRVKSMFRVSGLPIQRVLSLATKRNTLEGWMSINGKMDVELGQAGLVIPSMTGTRPIRLIVEDGRILNVPIMSKLLSVLNLPAMLQGEVDVTRNGLPFDQLRSAFTIANGLVTFKELVLDSPILKISGSGRYDFVADRLDMVLATSPLGSYSALLKRIPLFGRLFAGNREGFDTAVFEVKGASADPQITYLPVESLSRGVKGTAQFALDVLVNTLTLPKAMIDDFLADDDTGGDDAT